MKSMLIGQTHLEHECQPRHCLVLNLGKLTLTHDLSKNHITAKEPVIGTTQVD